MKFCSECGAEIIVIIPADDNRHRHVCSICATVYYQNPKIVAGCLPQHQDKILMCKRSIDPRSGYWTLPAGFMELEETAAEAAIRETLEEANARVEIIDLYCVFSLPHVNQVYMMYRANLKDLDFAPGAESLEVKLFDENSIPWGDLAFATIRETLKYYLTDRTSGIYPLHYGDIIREGNSYRFNTLKD